MPKTRKKAQITGSDTQILKGMSTREALAYWLAIPTKARNPASQKELAHLLGVSEERLCQIKRDPKFNDSVQLYRKEFFKNFTSDILESLRATALDGNERAAKLFLQVVEDFKETTKQEQERRETKTFVLQLPEGKLNELRELMQQIKQEKAREYLDAEVVEVPQIEDKHEKVPDEAKP